MKGAAPGKDEVKALEVTYMTCDGVKTDYLETQNIPEAIAELGCDGWQLVAIAPGTKWASDLSYVYRGSDYFFTRKGEVK